MSQRISYEQLQGELADADIILPKRGKRKLRPEDKLQQQCIAWLRIYQRTHRGRLQFIVAQNEGKRSYGQQARDRKMGRIGNAGHPELILIISDGYIGRTVFCELKASDGKLSDAQIGWRKWLLLRWFSWVEIRSVEDLERVVG